jgi:hypothetical protein
MSSKKKRMGKRMKKIEEEKELLKIIEEMGEKNKRPD